VKLSTNIRQYIGNFLLNRKLKRVSRRKEFNNLTSSKFVGILFNASDKDSHIYAKAFILDLEKRGLRVMSAGIADTALEIKEFPFTKNIEFFSFDDFDNFGLVDNDKLDNFIFQNFDIFIDLYNTDSYISKYIVGLTHAAMRIGKTESLRKYYDFMLAIPEGKSTKFFIEQIELYLSRMAKIE